MIKELELGKFRQCRVWLNEAPPFTYVASKFARPRIDAVGATSVPAFSVAVEMAIPVGAMTVYAALGLEFVPSPTGGLEVEIGTPDGSARQFRESLIASSDEVLIGLPEEFVAGVAAGFRDAQGTTNPALPSGTLVVTKAAHGLVSSNARIFRKLASWLAESRGSAEFALDEKRLASLAEGYSK